MKQLNNIDSLVAQLVMGWEYEEHRSGAGWKNEHGFYSHRVNCWNPSTRLEQAWTIVEKLNYDQKDLVWHVGEQQWCFVFGQDATNKWHAFADTAPLAICLAALQTVDIIFDSKEGEVR